MREGIDIDLCENCNLYTPFCEYSCPNGSEYIGSTVEHNGTIIKQYSDSMTRTEARAIIHNEVIKLELYLKNTPRDFMNDDIEKTMKEKIFAFNMAIDALDKAEKATVKPYERFEPCLCGCNSREHWSGVRNGKSYVRLECKRCGASVEGKNEADAKRNWNAYIRESR